MLLHDSYALPGEKHLFTDGKNLEMNGSTVKIVTKNEKVNGKEWNPAIGFYPKDFDYSSGIISTGSSFRTKYGRIEAKIKLQSSQDVFHAFWLGGETMLPQIDIFKCYNNKLFMSSFWGNPAEANGVHNDTASIKASKFAGNYFIYSLEWSPEKIVWKINDLEVKTQTSNIPSDPLYIVLNSGVVGDQPGIPVKLEIDWVRCYQKN
jgi:beta-glucanase (GH16 family)